MPRIQRSHPPRHLVVLDTNVLWRHEKSEGVASDEFQEFWGKNAEKYDLELRIPEVVRGELLYQHTSSAVTSLDRVNKQFQSLSGIAAKTYKHRLSETRLRKDIAKRVDAWIAKLNAVVDDTPTDRVDWSRVINDAVWRRPPFSPDEKNKEKGFRDCMILETVCDIARQADSTPVAFICGDSLLRESAEKRIGKSNHVSCYQSLEDFASYLRLLDEQLTKEFVGKIRRRARQKFFDSSAGDGLIITERVVERIRKEFSAEFTEPPRGFADVVLYPLSGESRPHWLPSEDEKIFVWQPSYQKTENKKEFVWSSRVSFIQVFETAENSIGGLLVPSSLRTEKSVRRIHFDVYWRANVSKDARFSNLSVDRLELAEKHVGAPTEQDIEKYGLIGLDETSA